MSATTKSGPPDLKLYGYWRSSSSWRVRIALALKGVAYDYQPINLIRDGGEQHRDAYRAINPMKQVPTLEYRDGGAVRRIGQSMAIIEHLEERFPAPPLLPADPYLRARARQLAEIVNSGIQPFQNTGVTKHVKQLGLDEQAFARHFIEAGLKAFEASLVETAGQFCVGDQVTLADVFLIPQLYGARRFGVPLEIFPRLTRIEEICAALPAFQAAHAERQIDAVPQGT